MPIGLFLSLLVQSAVAADATLPSVSAVSVATAQGQGVQIYHCVPQGGAFQWTLEAPEANLLEPGTGRQLGTHSAGPTWTWKDGSSITGTVVAKQPSPVAGAIPWLLIQTHAASATGGRLSSVTLVRRSETEGGNPPQTSCEESQAGTRLRVPYKATYTFYSTPAGSTAH